jgi:hypothetical protein
VVGEIKIKAKLSSAGAGTWAELGNMKSFAVVLLNTKIDFHGMKA